MRLKISQLFLFNISILLGLSGKLSAEPKSESIVVSGKFNKNNNSTITVEGKSLKGENIGGPAKLSKSDSDHSLSDHLRQANSLPQLNERLKRSASPIHGFDRALSVLLGSGSKENQDRKKIQAEIAQANRSRAILQQIIFPYLRKQSIGTPAEVRNTYYDNFKAASKALAQRPTESITNDEAQSVILALTQQLKYFEQASTAEKVCETYLGAKEIKLSETSGIIASKVIIPANTDLPGDDFRDFEQNLSAQYFSLSENPDRQNTRFEFTDSELDKLKSTIDGYEKFGHRTRAFAAAIALDLGAVDAHLIDLTASLARTQNNSDPFWRKIDTEIKLASLSRLQQAQADYKQFPKADANISTLLSDAYSQTLHSLSATDLVTQAQIASDYKNDEALADIIDTYLASPERKGLEDSEVQRHQLFEIANQALFLRANPRLLESLSKITMTTDERRSLFEKLKRLAPKQAATLVKPLVASLAKDIQELTLRREEIINEFVSSDNLPEDDRALFELQPGNRAMTLGYFRQIKSKLGEDENYLLSDEGKVKFAELKAAEIRIQNAMNFQIQTLRELTQSSSMDYESRANIIGQIAKLQLAVNGDWRAAVEILGDLDRPSITEHDYNLASQQINDLLPEISQAAFRQELLRSKLKSKFDRFLLQYYNPRLDQIIATAQLDEEAQKIVRAKDSFVRAIGERKFDDIEKENTESLNQLVGQLGKRIEEEAENIYNELNAELERENP